MDTPLVSICSITYNHAPYIRQCLDGFLMQKTKFRYEIIIHDDASTDGTTEIIKEYAEKHPDLITPIFQKENQYSKGIRGMFPRFCFPHAKGKYIALCEGDDYWTDPLKLQKQMDFLEANPDFVMCGHHVESLYEFEHKYVPFNIGINGTFKLSDLVHRSVFCPTLSVLFKKDSLNIVRYLSYRQSMDVVLVYHLLTQGNGFCLDDTMAVYRIHGGGVWSATSDESHLLTNIDVRFSIYDVEKSPESAYFLQNFISQLGRFWMIKHPIIMINALSRIYTQFGTRHLFHLLISIIVKRNHNIN